MIRQTSLRAVERLRLFLQLESAGGLVLVASACLALLAANIPYLVDVYNSFFELKLTITLGGFGLDKPLLLWINDALMALFFLLIGLELKREILEGQLSTPAQVMLPLMAALGGILVPSLIYLVFNAGKPGLANGWAIPSATDIAFSLAVLGLFGSRVPVALKIFLATIAVVDDLAAIVVIALFYSGNLSGVALALAGAGIALLFALNRSGVTRLAPYLLCGLFIWFCVLKSGVHATLAGVVVAAFIPLRADDETSPANHLEHLLHPWVAFAVLPLFAFANAGISFAGLSADEIKGSVPAGIFLGLFLGKQVGVMGMVGLACLLRIARLPAGTTWAQVHGVSALCGIGFTMSLFIGSLAFEHGDFNLLNGVKVGVLAGSLASALCGLLVLHFALPRQAAAEQPSG